jgi:hypothetical protein
MRLSRILVCEFSLLFEAFTHFNDKMVTQANEICSVLSIQGFKLSCVIFVFKNEGGGDGGLSYSTLACYGSAGFEKSKLLSKLSKWAIFQRDGGLLITV